jgi:1-acyl-sn-glycerol-3-phosphate acyltransferase
VSETFYKVLRCVGRAVFAVSSRPLILHRERAARPGAYLLVANHESPFDSALLIAAVPRVVYWLSIVELFRNPVSRWFLRSMLAAPLDRSRADTVTVRVIVRHLRAGRVVGLFPEGGLRSGAESVLEGGELNDGFARLAELARVPVLPCVVIGGENFRRWTSWLPLRRTRWAAAFGASIEFPSWKDRDAARAEFISKVEESLRQLRDEIRTYA